MTAVLLVFLGLFGVAIGSFLNVVIVRMPADESVLSPPSKCPLCETPIKGRDNIPIVSWVLLRGRCRSCHEPIPVGYPLIEAANGVLWIAAGIRFGADWVLLPYLFLFSVLLAQSVIDLELYRLPDKITLPALWTSAAVIPLVSVLVGEPEAIVGAFVGGIGYYLFLFVPFFIYPKGMGFGDVKLAALMGLYLGWINPILVLMAALIACVAGTAVGGVLYLVRGRQSREFAFGPWLAFGCVVAILASDLLLRS